MKNIKLIIALGLFIFFSSHLFAINGNVIFKTGAEGAYINYNTYFSLLNIYGIDKTMMLYQPASSLGNSDFFKKGRFMFSSPNSITANFVFENAVTLGATLNFTRIDSASRFGMSSETGELIRKDIESPWNIDAINWGDDILMAPSIRLSNLVFADEILFANDIPMRVSRYSLYTKGFGMSMKKAYGPTKTELFFSRLKTSEDFIPTYAQGLDDKSLRYNQYANSYLFSGKFYYDLKEKDLKEGVGFYLTTAMRDPGYLADSGSKSIFIKIYSIGGSASEIARIIDLQLVGLGKTIAKTGFQITDPTQVIEEITVGSNGNTIPNDTYPGAGDAYKSGYFVYEIPLSKTWTDEELDQLEYLELKTQIQGKYVIQVSADQTSWTTLFDRGKVYGSISDTDSDQWKTIRIYRKDFSSESGFFSVGAFADISIPFGAEKEHSVDLRFDIGVNKEILKNAFDQEALDNQIGSFYPFLDLNFSLAASPLQVSASYFNVPARFVTEIRPRKDTIYSSGSIKLVDDENSGYRSWEKEKKGNYYYTGEGEPGSSYYFNETVFLKDRNRNGVPDTREFDNKPDYPNLPGTAGYFIEAGPNLKLSKMLSAFATAYVHKSSFVKERFLFSYTTFNELTNTSAIEGKFENWKFFAQSYGIEGGVNLSADKSPLGIKLLGRGERVRDSIANSQLDLNDKFSADPFDMLYVATRGDLKDPLSAFDNLILEGGLNLFSKYTMPLGSAKLLLQFDGFGGVKYDTHYSNMAYRGTVLKYYVGGYEQLGTNLYIFPSDKAYQSKEVVTELHAKVSFDPSISLPMGVGTLAVTPGVELWKFKHQNDPDPILNREITLLNPRVKLTYSVGDSLFQAHAMLKKASFATEPVLNQTTAYWGASMSSTVKDVLTFSLFYSGWENSFDSEKALRESNLFSLQNGVNHFLAFNVSTTLDFKKATSSKNKAENTL